MSIKRKRTLYLILIIDNAFPGLASRKFSYLLPSFIADYSGDTLWALMVLFLDSFYFIEYSVRVCGNFHIFLLFLLNSVSCIQAGWINAIRDTRIGGLVLGYGF
ncbi:MAG: DUF2809 domain-containing protein [Ignavibacteria bacterium]